MSMERIEITITGELPEKGKFASLAAAQQLADTLIEGMDALGLVLTATVKAIRPSKKAAPPASPVRAVAAE